MAHLLAGSKINGLDIETTTGSQTKVNVHASNATIHVTAAERTTWNGKASTAVATTSTNGLLSSTDKAKLDGITAGANKYTLPQATVSALGGVMLSTATNSTSTTLAATASAVKAAYDLAASKTSATVATTSTNGLLSSTDKAKLDGVAVGANNYSLPAATASARGGVITGTNITNSSGTISVADATTSVKGVVQLSSATNSTSTTLAATTSAVKAAYDLAASKASTALASESAHGLMAASDKTKLKNIYVSGGRLLTTRGTNLGVANTSGLSTGVWKVSSKTSNTVMTLVESTALAASTKVIVVSTDGGNYEATVVSFNTSTRVLTVSYVGPSPYDSQTFSYVVAFNPNTDSVAFNIGTNNVSMGSNSVALNTANIVTGKDSLVGGTLNLITSNNSFTIGSMNEVRANNSVSLGYGNKVTGANAVALGLSNTISGNASLVSGSYSSATGVNSASLGNYTKAEGANTLAAGWSTTASGSAATSIGYGTIASNFATLALGKYNSMTVVNQTNTQSGMSAIVLGNGSTATSRANVFRVTFDGKVYGTAAFQTSGADYAEYFEWADGNPEDEDRRGIVVTLDGEKIRPAKQDDEYILGIISAFPSMVGDSYDDDWQHRYLKDRWGAPIKGWVDVDMPVKKERIVKDIVSGEEIIEKYTEIEKVKEYRNLENPDWDNTNIYKPRGERSEWDAVGLMGKLSVLHDGTCKPNGYAKVSPVDGYLCHSEKPTNIRVMSIIDDIVARVFIK